MPRYLAPIDPPVAGLSCEHCSDPIMATAEVRGTGMSIGGLREYRWLHVHGSDVCRPTTTARPYDEWKATTHVEAELAARDAAEDALTEALED